MEYTACMSITPSSYKNYLNEELERRIRINPKYSQRAFAKHLGLSPGELSEVLRGRRNLSLKSALRVAKALNLNPDETKHLVLSSQAEKVGNPNVAAVVKTLLGTEDHGDSHDSSSRQLTLDLFHLVSDWYCFAIVNLADCIDFRWSPTWIAKRLDITRAQAQLALERLERVGLIERHANSLRMAPDFVMSPSGIPSEAIRNYHRQIMQKATEALELQSIHEREFSGTSFAFDPKQIEAIKKDIAQFRSKLLTKYSKGKKTEVYHLELALFRITQSQNLEK